MTKVTKLTLSTVLSINATLPPTPHNTSAGSSAKVWWRCKYSALFWNPFGTRGFTDLSIISAKSLILVVRHTEFEPVTH
tara:strand:- start:26 stop:262 length:237 start_codon:yes stop_codon:yes gene_type:complete